MAEDTQQTGRAPLAAAPAAADATPQDERDDFTGLRPPMRYIAGVNEDTLRRAALAPQGGATAPLPADEWVTKGIARLENMIACLRAEGRFVDEEGEFTNDLDDLLSHLRTVPSAERSSKQEGDA